MQSRAIRLQCHSSALQVSILCHESKTVSPQTTGYARSVGRKGHLELSLNTTIRKSESRMGWSIDEWREGPGGCAVEASVTVRSASLLGNWRIGSAGWGLGSTSCSIEARR